MASASPTSSEAAGNLPRWGWRLWRIGGERGGALRRGGAHQRLGDPETDSSGGDDGSGAGERFGGGGGNGGYGKWYFEDPDSDASNFFLRGGATGIWWILLCAALSAYCILIGKAPHLGAMWGVVALGVGWGMFVAVAVGLVGLLGLFFLVDTVLLHTRSGRPRAQMVQKQISENLVGAEIDSTARPADKKAVSANANLKLPEGVQVMGTDAQLVQVELKAGEELSAEPGAMAYMSPACAPSPAPGWSRGGPHACVCWRGGLLLNNFKNVAKDGEDGHRAGGASRGR